MTLTIPAPDETRDRIGKPDNLGRPSREVVFRWETGTLDPTSSRAGRYVVDFEVEHNAHRKAYTGTLYLSTVGDVFTIRAFHIGGSQAPEAATVAHVFSEPTGRYSEKKLREHVDGALALLPTLVLEGSSAWHILRRIPGVVTA